VAAELVGAQSGLGYRIQMHRLVLETDGVLVGMGCIGLLGFGMDLLARRLERVEEASGLGEGGRGDAEGDGAGGGSRRSGGRSGEVVEWRSG
jgi:hypothetical protein